MPTLKDLTLQHSQRLSEIYRTRDVRLAEAQASRDTLLRGLREAARAFQKYDDELAVAREKQLQTEAKAEAARASALLLQAEVERPPAGAPGAGSRTPRSIGASTRSSSASRRARSQRTARSPRSPGCPGMRAWSGRRCALPRRMPTCPGSG